MAAVNAKSRADDGGRGAGSRDRDRPRITVENVSMAFGDIKVVDDASLSIRDHELLVIVGTSGGGKTTLLRAMAGLIPPVRGTVALDGKPVTGPTPAIAMVFQQFGLFPWKTVRDNIAYGLRVQNTEPDPAALDRLLDMMHLADRADAYPYQLSGGMQQRVGIARALAVEPEVLLMDEPFSALDALTREELQVELLSLWDRQERLTAALVTHDIDEAILLGDRIVVLRGRPGRIHLEVTVDIDRPRDPEEIRFHPSYPRLRKQIWEALTITAESPGAMEVPA
jgi:NitT/TauT family transport system ATP-binding protein